MLCSLVGDLKIAEVVDVPNMLVTIHFPKSIINQFNKEYLKLFSNSNWRLDCFFLMYIIYEFFFYN